MPSGGLVLDNNELASIRDGFSSITFGGVSSGTGAVTVDNVVLTDPVTVVGGSIAIQKGLSSEGGLTLTARDAAGAGHDVRINSGTVADTAGNVVINAGDDVTVAAGSTISALGAGASVAINVDPGPDADPGIGSNVALDGALTSSAVAVTAAADIDTLAVHGGGGNVLVSSSGVLIPATSTTIDITSVENITVTNATDIEVTGNFETTFTLSAVPSSTSAAIAISGGPVVTFDSSVTTNAVINGTDGDDTFVVDVSSGLPAGFFDFRGGLNLSTDPGDRILLQGTAPTAIGDLSLGYTNPNDGFIDIDGVTMITYTGLEPISSSIDAADVSLNFSKSPEAIDVTQNGNDVTVDSDSRWTVLGIWRSTTRRPVERSFPQR